MRDHHAMLHTFGAGAGLRQSGRLIGGLKTFLVWLEAHLQHFKFRQAPVIPDNHPALMICCESHHLPYLLLWVLVQVPVLNLG